MFHFFILIGAFYSYLSLSLLIVLPVRRVFRLQNSITERHLNAFGWTLLVSGIIVTCGYLLEIWCAWYGHSRTEWDPVVERFWGNWYARSYCILLITNSLIPMALWFKRIRINAAFLFLIAMGIQCGMWLEHLAIVHASM